MPLRAPISSRAGDSHAAPAATTRTTTTSAPADDGERGVVGRGEQPEEPLGLAAGHAQHQHPRAVGAERARPTAGASSTVTPASTGPAVAHRRRLAARVRLAGRR